MGRFYLKFFSKPKPQARRNLPEDESARVPPSIIPPLFASICFLCCLLNTHLLTQPSPSTHSSAHPCILWPTLLSIIYPPPHTHTSAHPSLSYLSSPPSDPSSFIFHTLTGPQVQGSVGMNNTLPFATFREKSSHRRTSSQLVRGGNQVGTQHPVTQQEGMGLRAALEMKSNTCLLHSVTIRRK